MADSEYKRASDYFTTQINQLGYSASSDANKLFLILIFTSYNGFYELNRNKHTCLSDEHSPLMFSHLAAIRSIAPKTLTPTAPSAKIDVLHLYHKHIVINAIAREARHVQFLL
jgi:hypothetical protein